jgi:hypothetical protein
MPALPSVAVPADLAELKSAVAANQATDHFIKRNDGATVLDTTTGLEWSADAIATNAMTWDNAKQAVVNANVAGHNDWRLPTVQELLTLVDYERRDPAINTDLFTCKSSYYWSSTPCASSSGYAWGVYFYYGDSGWCGVDYWAFVRAVRAPSQ